MATSSSLAPPQSARQRSGSLFDGASKAMRALVGAKQVQEDPDSLVFVATFLETRITFEREPLGMCYFCLRFGENKSTTSFFSPRGFRTTQNLSLTMRVPLQAVGDATFAVETWYKRSPLSREVCLGRTTIHVRGSIVDEWCNMGHLVYARVLLHTQDLMAPNVGIQWLRETLGQGTEFDQYGKKLDNVFSADFLAANRLAKITCTRQAELWEHYIKNAANLPVFTETCETTAIDKSGAQTARKSSSASSNSPFLMGSPSMTPNAATETTMPQNCGFVVLPNLWGGIPRERRAQIYVELTILVPAFHEFQCSKQQQQTEPLLSSPSTFQTPRVGRATTVLLKQADVSSAPSSHELLGGESIPFPTPPTPQLLSQWLELEVQRIDLASAYWQLDAESQGIVDQNTRQIDKDVSRTFGTHNRTKMDNDEGIVQLRRLLCVYAHYNPKVGYCQAMNLIAAHLMLAMDEVHAFRVLDYICKTVLRGSFDKSMSGAMKDLKTLEAVLCKRLPKLMTHMHNLDVPIAIITSQWVIGAFINIFPTEVVFRIFDVMLVYGRSVLYAVMVSFFNLISDELMKLEDSTEVIMHVRQAHENLFDAHLLLEETRTEFAILSAELPEIQKSVRDELKTQLEATSRRLAINELSQVSALNDTQVESLYDRFRKKVASFAQTDRGSVNVDEVASNRGMDAKTFSEFMMELSPVFTEDLCLRLFLSFDMNGDGLIDIPELTCCIGILCLEGSFEKRLEDCFNVFDTNKNGRMDKVELTRMFDLVYRLVFGIELTKDSLRSITDRALERCHFGENVSLTLDEFSQVALSQPLIRTLVEARHGLGVSSEGLGQALETAIIANENDNNDDLPISEENNNDDENDDSMVLMQAPAKAFRRGSLGDTIALSPSPAARVRNNPNLRDSSRLSGGSSIEDTDTTCSKTAGVTILPESLTLNSARAAPLPLSALKTQSAFDIGTARKSARRFQLQAIDESSNPPAV